MKDNRAVSSQSMQWIFLSTGWKQGKNEWNPINTQCSVDERKITRETKTNRRTVSVGSNAKEVCETRMCGKSRQLTK